MKKIIASSVVLALLTTAAFAEKPTEEDARKNTSEQATGSTDRTTGTNDRISANNDLTAEDQSDKPEDLKITQDIRQAVVKDDNLSMTAKNVKIITIDGKVTLRGGVKTAAEKETINKLALVTVNEKHLTNEIEVTPED